MFFSCRSTKPSVSNLNLIKSAIDFNATCEFLRWKPSISNCCRLMNTEIASPVAFTDWVTLKLWMIERKTPLSIILAYHHQNATTVVCILIASQYLRFILLYLLATVLSLCEVYGVTWLLWKVMTQLLDGILTRDSSETCHKTLQWNCLPIWWTFNFWKLNKCQTRRQRYGKKEGDRETDDTGKTTTRR